MLKQCDTVKVANQQLAALGLKLFDDFAEQTALHTLRLNLASANTKVLQIQGA